jgi:adenosylmethionine-8-amino-7-oxononanoate aminotransferase
VAQACAKRGVLVYPMQGSLDGISGDHILIAPPAIITEPQIDWSIEQVREGINEAQGSI